MQEVKIIKELDLGHSWIGLRDDGIVECRFGTNTDLDVKEARDILKATGELTNGKKALVLNIAGDLTSATSAAREFAATAEATQYTLAEAYVINNLAQKLIGNFYVSFNKPVVPTKIFTSIEEATVWLKGLSV